jgi:hypothetical protein
LYRHCKPNEPTKKGFLSFVLFESPFALVSTVSRGHSSIVSAPETGERRLDERLEKSAARLES